MKRTIKQTEASRLTCSALQVGYGTTPLLPPLDMHVCAGEVWALVGRNGSGKSTLLRTLVGELPPVTGQFSLRPGTLVAHVAQRGSHDLCVPSRAWDMVEAGVDRGWGFLSWRARDTSVRRALKAVGAEELARTPYAHLSEGQKQRILMARALSSHPNVLLLDEPTSSMDPMTERQVFALIDELRTTHELAVIIASHSMSALPSIATHVAFVDRDDQLALTGARSTVLSDPRFQTHYGHVMAESEST